MLYFQYGSLPDGMSTCQMKAANESCTQYTAFINYVRVPREGWVWKKSLHTLTLGRGGGQTHSYVIFPSRYYILEIVRSSDLAGIIFRLSNNRIMVICS